MTIRFKLLSIQEINDCQTALTINGEILNFEDIKKVLTLLKPLTNPFNLDELYPFY